MKIAVPLDLSEVADEAIQPAEDIARGLGDEIVFVAVAGRRLRSDLREAADAEHADVPDLIEGHLRSAVANLEGVAAEFVVIRGDDPAEALVDFCTRGDIRMIVMATHGRSGVARWRMGSVAERVVRHSVVPVLTVPAKQRVS